LDFSVRVSRKFRQTCNWIVIEQQPDPGSVFAENEALLSVLKEDEVPIGTC